LIGAVVLGGILAGILFSLLFAHRIVGPVRQLTGAMTQLAKGVLDVPVPARDRVDEIGDMAAALQVFKDNANQARRLGAEREQEQNAKEARTQREAEQR